MRRWATWGVYLLLTVVVAGLFAADRGFIQDEFWVFAHLRQHSAERFPWLLTENIRRLHPLRPLTALPFAFAEAIGDPRRGLQAVCVLTWLAGGLAAGCLLRALAPARRAAEIAA